MLHLLVYAPLIFGDIFSVHDTFCINNTKREHESFIKKIFHISLASKLWTQPARTNNALREQIRFTTLEGVKERMSNSETTQVLVRALVLSSFLSCLLFSLTIYKHSSLRRAVYHWEAGALGSLTLFGLFGELFLGSAVLVTYIDGRLFYHSCVLTCVWISQISVHTSMW